jgi:hypothetical protein
MGPIPPAFAGQQGMLTIAGRSAVDWLAGRDGIGVARQFFAPFDARGLHEIGQVALQPWTQLGLAYRDGLLRFVGRDDEMIKVAGNRISPQEIEEAALAGGEALRRPFGIAPIALRHQRPGMDQLARLSGGGAGAVCGDCGRCSRRRSCTRCTD